jgi:predicted glutamine amidotransferase
MIDNSEGFVDEGQSTGGEITPEMEDQIRQIEALASMDAAFANSQEYKDLMAATKGTNSQSSETDEDEDEDEDYEDEDDDSEEEDDDIFGVTKQTKVEKEVELTFEPTKEMQKFIESKYGVKDVAKFFSSADTWRNQAQESSELKRELDLLTSDLQAMPVEIRQAVTMWANGQDYTAAFNQSQRLDFSSDFTRQDPENLVQHYLSEQYDELLERLENGKIDEDDFDDRIKLLAGSTKRMFNSDKEALDNERDQFTQRQKEEFQAMKKSALVSVENLSKAYPNFSKTEVARIRNILVEGKIDNLFTKADGSYNDDAAELVAYAMYGKKMLESIKKGAERRGESKANQRIVDTSAKQMRKQKVSGETQGFNMKEVQHLSSMFKNDPYA